MALRLEQKQQIVAEVKEIAASALSAVIADYRGLTVDQMTVMRAKARENSVYLRVVRNTLARRAVEDTPYSCLTETFVGPTLMAFSHEDPGAAARLIKEFAKEHDALEVKALSLGGDLIAADQIDRVASLPTLDQARAMLMGVMMAPLNKLARTMKEVPAKLTRTVAAIRDEKQAQA